jgi:uncharacterized repeat protein (TIGR02543 family)
LNIEKIRLLIITLLVPAMLSACNMTNLHFSKPDNETVLVEVLEEASLDETEDTPDYPVYTVTFDANGGEWTSGGGSTTLDGIFTTFDTKTGYSTVGGNMPPDPSRTDYTFACWNTAQDGSIDSVFTDTTPVGDIVQSGQNSITVYAQWALADSKTLSSYVGQ